MENWLNAYEMDSPRTCDKLNISQLKAQLKMTDKKEVKRIEYLQNLIDNKLKTEYYE